VAAFLESKECPINEISQLTDEEITALKEIMKKNIVSPFMRGLSEVSIGVLEIIIDILGKRVLVENPTIKLEQVVNKIKLMPLPEGVYPEREEEKIVEGEGEEAKETTVVHEPNTNEKALIVLTVPQEEKLVEKLEEENDSQDEEKSDSPLKKVMVDVDQQDKALALKTRDVEGANYWFVNSYAARRHREAFIEYMNKMFPEFFEDNEDFDAISAHVQKKAVADLQSFVSKKCDEY
jgi:hypothetical protein